MTNLLLLSKGAIVGIIVAVVAVILVIILVSWYVNTRNGLVRIKNLVEEGWATIDVQLKKRYDLIPNLVETVKGYAKHESGALEAVVRARYTAMSASGDDKIAAENMLTGTLKTLFSITESYPDLKANTNFMDLQGQLKNIEAEIASARRYYNGTVKEYNTKIELFPTNIVAGSMHLEKRKYFELDSAEERKAPAVKF